jgi:DNA-binding MarR family transcriptional regulator
VGLADDTFARFRRITFEGELLQRMAELSSRVGAPPGVVKTLTKLADHDGISMGELARKLGSDPSYITALVDDLDSRGLARREPAPDDRRVKIIVLTAKGRRLAEEIQAFLSVPPASFAALSKAELIQLRDLLDKVIAADPELSPPTAASRAASSLNCRSKEMGVMKQI